MLNWFNFSHLQTTISIFTKYIFWVILYSLGQAYILQLLWNSTIPHITVIFNPILYMHAFSLIIISRILTRSWVKDTLQELASSQLYIISDLNARLQNLSVLISTKIHLDESRIQNFDESYNQTHSQTAEKSNEINNLEEK